MRSQFQLSPRQFRVGTVAALSAAALAAPAAAQASNVVVDRSCYPEGSLVTMAGGGFTPGSTVSISGSGISGNATVAANGGFLFQGNAPLQTSSKPGTTRIPVTVTDGAGVSSLTSVRVARLGVSTKPSGGNPRRRVRWRFSGFKPGSTIYSHVRRGGHTWTHKFGKAKGPCGTLKKKARGLPIPRRRIHTGTYKVQIDARHKFHSDALPRLTFSLTVFRTFG